MKESVISKAVVDLLLKHLAAQGIDCEALHSLYSVLPPEAEGLASSVPLASFLRLFSKAAELTGDENIGLQLYRNIDLADFGLLAFASMNARTIAHALDVYVRYQGIYQSHSENKVERDEDGKQIFTYRLLDTSLPISRYDNDLAMSLLVYWVRNLSGNKDWSPSEVYFTHSAPDDLSAYQSVFHCPVYFDAPESRAVITDDLDAIPVQGGDNRLFSILEADLKRLFKEVGGEDYVLRVVQQAVAEALYNGVPAIEDVAEQLNMEPRSLQRRLREAGQTYKGVVEETRKQLARRYLESTDHSLVEVAFLLGYSELSAFIRAFRRWTGDTPQQYRLKSEKL